jgi:hypothetical protein
LLAEGDNYANHTITKYENKTYNTVSKTTMPATLNDANYVINKLIEDITNQPESLFDNILKGLGSAKESGAKSKFVIEYAGYTYDKESKLYTGSLNIFIGNTRISNIKFTGQITRDSISGKRSEAFFELLEINSLAKEADGRLVVEKMDDKSIQITQTANFRFGWLLNLFFSMSNYKEVAEWRLDRLLSNIKQEVLKINYANELKNENSNLELKYHGE